MNMAPAQQVQYVYFLAVCNNDVATAKTYVSQCCAPYISKKWMW